MRDFRTLYIASVLLILAASPVLARDCTPTVAMTGGTHYKPVTIHKEDIGKGLFVSGRILSAIDCKPIPNAKIAHWQAGENGQYQDRLRAYLFSDNKGRYHFHTEWPAAMVAHIHFIVSADEFESVGTQWIGGKQVNSINFDIVLRPQ